MNLQVKKIAHPQAVFVRDQTPCISTDSTLSKGTARTLALRQPCIPFTLGSPTYVWDTWYVSVLASRTETHAYIDRESHCTFATLASFSKLLSYVCQNPQLPINTPEKGTFVGRLTGLSDLWPFWGGPLTDLDIDRPSAMQNEHTHTHTGASRQRYHEEHGVHTNRTKTMFRTRLLPS